MLERGQHFVLLPCGPHLVISLILSLNPTMNFQNSRKLSSLHFEFILQRKLHCSENCGLYSFSTILPN